MYLANCKKCKTEFYTTADFRLNSPHFLRPKCPECGNDQLRMNHVTDKACASLFIRGMKEKFGKFWRDNG